MASFRGLDTDIGWQRREFRKVWAAIREANAAKRLGASTVAAGGSLVVRGILKVVGNVSMVTSDGTELLRIGDMQFGRGLDIKRDDGTYALRFRKAFDVSTVQTLEIHDRLDQIIVADNSLGGGLSQPYLEHHFQPVAPASGTAITCGPYGWERTHNSSTWTDMFAYDGKVQNPFLDLKFAAKCSDGTTAGEIQVVDDMTGTPLPGFFASPWVGSIPAGTTTLTVIDPTPAQVALPVNNSVGAQMRLAIQVRRTAGTGTITLSVAQSIGG